MLLEAWTHGQHHLPVSLSPFRCYQCRCSAALLLGRWRLLEEKDMSPHHGNLCVSILGLPQAFVLRYHGSIKMRQTFGIKLIFSAWKKKKKESKTHSFLMENCGFMVKEWCRCEQYWDLEGGTAACWKGLARQRFCVSIHYVGPRCPDHCTSTARVLCKSWVITAGCAFSNQQHHIHLHCLVVVNFKKK